MPGGSRRLQQERGSWEGHSPSSGQRWPVQGVPGSTGEPEQEGMGEGVSSWQGKKDSVSQFDYGKIFNLSQSGSGVPLWGGNECFPFLPVTPSLLWLSAGLPNVPLLTPVTSSLSAVTCTFLSHQRPARARDGQHVADFTRNSAALLHWSPCGRRGNKQDTSKSKGLLVHRNALLTGGGSGF